HSSVLAQFFSLPLRTLASALSLFFAKQPESMRYGQHLCQCVCVAKLSAAYEMASICSIKKFHILYPENASLVPFQTRSCPLYQHTYPNLNPNRPFLDEKAWCTWFLGGHRRKVTETDTEATVYRA